MVLARSVADEVRSILCVAMQAATLSPPWRQQRTSSSVLPPAATLRFVCGASVVLPGWLHPCKDDVTTVLFHRVSETAFRGGRYCLQFTAQPSGCEYLWYLHIAGRESLEFLWCLSADWLAYDSYAPCDQQWYGRLCAEPVASNVPLDCYFESVVPPPSPPRDLDALTRLTNIVMQQGAQQKAALDQLQQNITENRESKERFEHGIMDMFESTVKSINGELDSFSLGVRCKLAPTDCANDDHDLAM